MSKIRLDKFIADQVNISRSSAVTDIRRGFVKVDGCTVRTPSFCFCPEENTVDYKNENIEYKKYVYILMNKPKGVLSASTDKSRETVIDIVPEELRRKNLAPVGRLDKDTTGLLIITDDGNLSHEITSPKRQIKKCYEALLDGCITDEMIKLFASGVVLADGTKCLPAQLKKLSDNKAEITVYEGKYHQIKRMFGTVGLGVNELSRKSIGNIQLPNNIKAGGVLEVNLAYLLNRL